MTENPFQGLAARKRALERRALEEGMNVAGRWQVQLPMVREVLGQFGDAVFPGAEVAEAHDRVLLRDATRPSTPTLVEVALAYHEVKRKIGFVVTRRHEVAGEAPSVEVAALREELIAALIRLFPEWH